jgi:hypothetical protein
VRSRLLVGIAAALVLAAAVVGGILFVREDDPPTAYDADIEDDFMATCTADAEALGFSDPAGYCGCAFDRIRAEIPFDEYLEIDAALAADPADVPARLDRIRTACYLEVEVGASATTAPPVEIPLTTAPA